MSMDELMALVPIEATVATKRPDGRRSRWERSVKAQKGKSKWGSLTDKPYLPPPYVDLPPGLTPLQVDQFLREQRFEELSLKFVIGELEFGDPDIRDPSPPPVYDKDGNRTNTRDIRVKHSMQAEHQRLLEFMVNTVEGFVPPADYKPSKKVRRIMIPQDKYPEYNFMGLIIGPRGCNHKRLEAESGAQISIRGRGTQKEGKKTDHQTDEEAQMPQHVHIAADSEAKLEKAVALIEPLLDPFHPAHEEFKKRGLEQLALVNGVTLTKAEQRCSVCGAVGHLGWECPEANYQSFKKAQVKCAICGDMGHVTMDCKQAKGLTLEQVQALEAAKKATATDDSLASVAQLSSWVGTGAPPPPPPPPPPGSVVATSDSEKWKLEQEYDLMMSELTGGPNDKSMSAPSSGNGTNKAGADSHSLSQPTSNDLSNSSFSDGKSGHGVPAAGTRGSPMAGTYASTPPPGGVSPVANNNMGGRHGGAMMTDHRYGNMMTGVPGAPPYGQAYGSSYAAQEPSGYYYAQQQQQRSLASRAQPPSSPFYAGGMAYSTFSSSNMPNPAAMGNNGMGHHQGAHHPGYLMSMDPNAQGLPMMPSPSSMMQQQQQLLLSSQQAAPEPPPPADEAAAPPPPESTGADSNAVAAGKGNAGNDAHTAAMSQAMAAQWAMMNGLAGSGGAGGPWASAMAGAWGLGVPGVAPAIAAAENSVGAGNDWASATAMWQQQMLLLAAANQSMGLGGGSFAANSPTPPGPSAAMGQAPEPPK